MPNVPRRHPLEESVPHDQRVKQDRPKVSDERQEKQVREDGVGLPQHEVQHGIVAKDKSQMHGSKEDDVVFVFGSVDQLPLTR